MTLTVTARKDIDFLVSSGASWPDEADYRPAGWTSLRSPAEVGQLDALVAKSKKRDTAPHGLDAATLVEVEAHAAILRQCWVTPEYVWRLAELMVGPPEVDPFWNAWAHTHRLWSGVRLLDGRDGRNGFDVSLWGRVEGRGWSTASGREEVLSERGRTAYVNGPHGDAGAYVSACVRARDLGHRVAAVVALDGCGWFAGNTVRNEDLHTCSDVSSCDVLAIPEGGRMSFEGPPGIRPSSPTKGYALAMWGVPDDVYNALWVSSPAAVRVVVGGQRWVLWPGCCDSGLVSGAVELKTLLDMPTRAT